MIRIFFIVLFFISTGAAMAQFNGCPPGFCPSVFGGGGKITPPSHGKILLVNGSNFLLQTNGTNKICRAGGC